MPVKSNRTSSDFIHANAFTNNTFNLKETELAIKSKVFNSFQYLKGLQKSYVDFDKFILSEDDLFMDIDKNIYVSVSKDFIEVAKRKLYKESEFYNQYLTLDTIGENPEIFSYFPIVLLDGKSIFSFELKCTLDAKIDIKFTHIDKPKAFMEELHIIEITFVKYPVFNRCVTNKYVLDNHDWKLPDSVTGKALPNNYTTFMFLRGTEFSVGSPFFITKIENAELVIDKSNDSIYQVFMENPEVEIVTVSVPDLIELSEPKQIQRRVDNNRITTIFTIEKNDGTLYNMPIAEDSIILFRVTKDTGETEYICNTDITLHYPNIYEIMSDELDDNFDKYEYRVFYLYKDVDNYFKYANAHKYIHMYLKRVSNTNTLEEMVKKFIYTTDMPTDVTDFFFTIFNYTDNLYKYSMNDYLETIFPYDFDYKIYKMTDFVTKDPIVLKQYGEKVSVPGETYYLRTKKLDLEKRKRTSTRPDVTREDDIKDFDEERYFFAFRNETYKYLSLRFFIDGVLCTDIYQTHVDEFEYIYIPTSYIKEDSYIEVEKFNRYQFSKDAIFTSTGIGVEIEFPEPTEIIHPTLYDLFVLDKDGNRIDRSKFKIFCLIDKDAYDVSDDLVSGDNSTINMLLNNKYVEDTETGEIYIDIDELFSVDETDPESGSVVLDDEVINNKLIDSRMELKYMLLKKIKVMCKDLSLLNKELTFMVNKIPYMETKTMKSSTLTQYTLFDGEITWREDVSYIRIFLDGRLIDLDYNLMKNKDGISYLLVNCSLPDNSQLTVDVTPYSYELEYELEKIPDDFILEFNGALSKPFSFKYYDMYINGVKLNDRNIQYISADKIKLFNIKSMKNLKIYRRDRDIEFYGFGTAVSEPIDNLFDMPICTDDDKDAIIKAMIDEFHGDEIIKDGEDTEEDINNNIKEVDRDLVLLYSFFLDFMSTQGVIRPSDFTAVTEDDFNTMRTYYPEMYTDYVVDDSIVMLKPNLNPTAEIVVMLGPACNIN